MNIAILVSCNLQLMKFVPSSGTSDRKQYKQRVMFDKHQHPWALL